jgi:hypothetical protein
LESNSTNILLAESYSWSRIVRIDSEVRERCGKSKLSLCELAHMEDSSFFREQAERCRRQAENADPMLQITLQTLAVDCIAYADELDDPDDYWFANRAQTETETTSPTKPRWSVIQKILVGILVIMTPGIFVLAALML